MGIETVDAYLDGGFSKLEGWCSIQKAKKMARIVAAIQSESPLCVELGVWGGRSLFAMALALKHCLGKGRADGIDPYAADASLEGTHTGGNNEWWATVDYEKTLKGVQDAIDQLSLRSYVNIIRKRSQDVSSTYKKETIDVLHQDSNHSEEISTTEVALYASKVRRGGYWVFDDINWDNNGVPTTLRAQKMLLTRGFTKIEEYTETGNNAWAIFQKP